MTTREVEQPAAAVVALQKIKVECLTTKDAVASLGHITRLCIDAGIREPYYVLQERLAAAAADSESAADERGTRSLERVARLCARWRAESERLWRDSNNAPSDKARMRADTLDSVADELELELGAAGAGPSDQALPHGGAERTPNAK